ncbi:MAG: hypothetical protein FWD57_04210 [Polyangiaceae bacterium]|nr:hypothetical protein [Polyangiaceae bacterium]
MRRLSIAAAASLSLACIVTISTGASADDANCHVEEGISSSFVWCENDLTKMPEVDRAARLASGPMQSSGSSGDQSIDRPKKRDLPGAPTDPAFDWRNVDGDNWLTPVRDQASCGSCFVFGTLASFESQLKFSTGNPSVDFDLSEQHVIACVPAGNCKGGGIAEEVGLYLRTSGVSDEACYPYAAKDGDCSKKCSDWTSRRVFIERMDFSTLPWAEAEIKSALMQGPVIVNMQVYSDFYGYKSGVYSRGTSAKKEGWHMVTLVGWDDSDKSWIVRNSWGKSWGENGYFKISRNPDCLVFVTGVCFASHVATIQIDPEKTPGVPCLSSTEVKLHATVGETATGTFDISNCGRAGDVKIATTSPSWLTSHIEKPTLAVDESTTVTIEASAAALKAGTHTANLQFKGGPGISTMRVVFDVDPKPEPDPPDPPPPEPSDAGTDLPTTVPVPPDPVDPEPEPSAEAQEAESSSGGGCATAPSSSGFGMCIGLGIAGIWLATRRRR